MNRGLFITLEGSDGSGKSSQIRRLASALRRRGMEVLLTGEPGGTALGRKIRKILLDPATGALDPRTEVFLYEAARVEHVEKVIRPALRSGKTVLCSRFSDSTLAYQGGARGLGLKPLVAVDRWARGGLKPNLSLVLDLPPSIGLKRVRSRGRRDRLEREGASFQARVRRAFGALARKEPGRVRIVNAAGRRDEVHQRLLGELSRLHGWGGKLG